MAWYQNFMHEYEPDAKTAALIYALRHGGTFRPETVNLTEALKLDRERYSSDKNPRPFDLAIQLFVSFIGDLDITRITRIDVSRWIAHECHRGLSPATIRRHLSEVQPARRNSK